MANYILEVVRYYDRWLRGEDLSSDEILDASKKLGSPTRSIEAFLSRYRQVFGGLIDERCSESREGRICLYSWNRRAYKRYFPAALDAGGTVISFPEGGEPLLYCYPLHRSMEVGVRGVEIPEEAPRLAVPRLEGVALNLCYYPDLDKWLFSTRFALHNMYFEGRSLVVRSYGEIANPHVRRADRLAKDMGLYERMDQFTGWTLTLLLGDNGKLSLIAARRPDGRLVAPSEVGGIASELGLGDLSAYILSGKDLGDLYRAARESIEYRSMFFWYDSNPEHPLIIEARSEFYEDYVRAVKEKDARSLAVLLTGAPSRIVESLSRELGEELIGQVSSSIKDLEEALLEPLDEDKAFAVLTSGGLDPRSAREALKAVRGGKPKRALRIILARALDGWKLEDAPYIVGTLASNLRELARPGGRESGE